MRQRHLRPSAAPLLSLSLCALFSCALPGPPYDAPPATADTAPATALRIVEGQPRGLLLELSAQRDRAGQLVLLRLEAGADAFEVLYRFEDHGPHRFLDRQLVPDGAYRYAAGLEVEGVVGEVSAPAEIGWLRPPDPPTDLRASALGRHVELEWTPCDGCGGLAFRRTLGERGYVRLTPLVSEGRFVDAPGRPGAVLGYTVSSVLWSEGVPILGPPSAEVYVEAMQTGSLIPAPTPDVPASPTPETGE